MKHARKRNHGLLAIFVTAAALACASASTRPALAADTYPSRPITMVLPFPAGTVTDMTIRLIADHLARAFGSPVVVENKG